MRLEIIGLMLLSACEPMPTCELVSCPASAGWTYEDHVKLAGEYPRLKACCPESARALIEYSEMKPDRRAIFSGLRSYE